MSIAGLLRIGVPPLVGGGYYAVIAAMLAALAADREPQRPVFKISGYAVPATRSSSVGAPAPPRRPAAPPKVLAVAALSPTAPLPAVKPAAADLAQQPVDDASERLFVANDGLAQPDLPAGPRIAGDPNDRPSTPAGQEAGADVPPSPEEGPLPPSWATPGGSTLVLAVLLGADGTVLKTKILVPSGDAVANLTFGLALQSARDLQLHIDPPLQPGESRWLVVPVDFSTGAEALP